MKRNKYSLGRNIIFHLKSAKQWNKWVCYFQFLDVIPDMSATFLGIWLPSLIVSELQEGVSLKVLMASIIIISLGMLISKVINAGMSQYLYRHGLSLTLYYDKLAFEKTMKIDYDLLESKDVRKLMGNVWGTLRNEFAIRWSVTAMPELIISVFSSVLYGVLLCRINYVLVLVLILTILVNAFLLKQVRDVHGENHKELSRYTRAVSYINSHAMERSDGKDIRIFQMQDWFLKKYDDAILGMDRIYGKIHTQYFLRRFKELGFGFIAEIISYGYLAYLMSERRISVSEFVFSIGIVRTFLANFSRLIYMIQNLNNIHAFLTYIRKLLDLPEKEEREFYHTDRNKGVEIEFKDVSFRYPDADTEVLSNINITIHSNEKLALIGLNGAGKTTFVKLLCGFYKPTKGEIFVNGIPQSEYDRDEYVSLVSALFQDSMLFPVTVDENLTGSVTEQTDAKRLEYVLKLSGFEKRYESFSQGGKTKMVREANENATDVSGGEKQKLLFARALYKKAPLMILDEPTAALDPIAENELYLKYGEAAKNRTVVFISHRLSSTRFCDRIALLEGAHIIEEGTHEELLLKNGRYAELFELQSKYYREGEVG
ncbi:MAG: ABC transporter ATP-binding protein/permease [Lachnospiraceae bacterium]|nr:ABC transporter ATP-binding protein/permease [Lachnospiraceae bacterium]